MSDDPIRPLPVEGRIEAHGSPCGPIELRPRDAQEVTDRHRAVFCPEYDTCLRAALRNAWRSWTCSRCPEYARERDHRARGAADRATLRPRA